MGGCTSDIYKLAKKEHGQLLQKFIVGSQSLLEFKRYIRKKEEQYDTKVQNKRIFLHDEVKMRQEQMQTSFNEVKTNLDAQLPGGVQSLEQMKKDFVENILGLQQYKKRFDGVHSQIDRQVDQRRDKTHRQFAQIVKKAEDQYQIDPQKMKLYHEASQQKRAIIRQKGIKQFGQSIKQRLQELQKNNAQALDLNVQLQRFDSIVSLQHVDHLVSLSKNKFRTQALTLVGGSFDSNIRI